MRISRFLREQDDTYDRQALILESDRDPLDIALRRARALCDKLKVQARIGDLDQQLEGLASQAAGVDPSNVATRKDLYGKVCAVRRKIALSNPLLTSTRFS